MEKVILKFDQPVETVADLPPDLIRPFWASGLALVDFVQGIQKGSSHFWDYFEPVR
jgi:hypothetical protein